VGQYRGEGAAVIAAEPTGEGGAACSSTARPPARARGARGGRRAGRRRTAADGEEGSQLQRKREEVWEETGAPWEETGAGWEQEGETAAGWE
jgi:hypothetical protein